MALREVDPGQPTSNWAPRNSRVVVAGGTRSEVSSTRSLTRCSSAVRSVTVIGHRQARPRRRGWSSASRRAVVADARPGSRALSPVTRQPSRLEYSGAAPSAVRHRRRRPERRTARGPPSASAGRSRSAAMRCSSGRPGAPFRGWSPGTRRRCTGTSGRGKRSTAHVDLVAGEDRHGELAAGHHQRMGVVLGRHARHDDRLLEADLGDPVAGRTLSSRLRGEPRPPRPL